MGVKVKEKLTGSGVFWLFINHKGRRISKRVGTEEAAKIAAKKIEARLTLGESALPANKPTVPKLGTYYEKFNQNYLETVLRHSARLRHQSNFNIHILPALGQLDEITREMMQELIAELIRKELSEDSIRLALAAVRVLFNYAIDNKVVTENPVVRLSKYYSQVKRVRDEIDPLTAEEVSLLLQTVLNSKFYRDYYPVFLCAIHAGLRAGELTGLQWSDVDFNGRFLTVRRNIVHRRVNLPKNGKTRRVDMSDALSEALQELKKARKEIWLAKGQNEIPEWVFCNCEGKLLDTNNLRNRALHQCLEAAKRELSAYTICAIRLLRC